MAYNNIPIAAIDLFCGAGGLSLGLENSGIPVLLGIENNHIAAQTYRNNQTGCIIEDDIRNISVDDIYNRINIGKNELLLLAGCPPCQTFSSLQKADAQDDDRNYLIFEYVRLVNELRPLFILMENVPGLKGGRGKNIFKQVLSNMSEQYVIVSEVLNCADFGIRQCRKRLVLHGIRRDAFDLLQKNIKDFSVTLPKATHSENPSANSDTSEWVSSESAFADLPPVKAGDPAPDGFPNHETAGLTDINLKRIQYIQAHGGSRTCLPPELQLSCHQKANVGYTGVYGIIDPSKPAPTITGGCITFSKGRYGHPYQPRAITVREAARLQSFPDTYVFYGNRAQTALQVGNAIPPHLAEESGKYFLNILNILHQIP